MSKEAILAEILSKHSETIKGYAQGYVYKDMKIGNSVMRTYEIFDDSKYNAMLKVAKLMRIILFPLLSVKIIADSKSRRITIFGNRRSLSASLLNIYLFASVLLLLIPLIGVDLVSRIFRQIHRMGIGLVKAIRKHTS